jgi:hypothetical protein
MTSSTSPKVTGGLLALIGLLGIVVLATDHVLWGVAPLHAYGLIVFVIVDFALCGFLLTKPSKMAFTLTGGWCILRIIIQLGDIALAPSFFLTYTQFAEYLFSPLVNNPPNAPGIPGALIDAIMILEIAVIWITMRVRSSKKAT